MTGDITHPVPTDTSGGDLQMLRVPVHGMTCEGCAKTVHRGLSRLQGVEQVSVDADAAVATVTGDVDETTVRRRVTEMGYDLTPADEDRSWSVLKLGGVITAVVLIVALGLWAFTHVSGAVAGTGAAQATFEQVSLVAFALAFAFGLAAAFAPSSLAMTPAVVGVVLQGHAHSRRRAAVLAVAFVAGVLVVDALVGAGSLLEARPRSRGWKRAWPSGSR